MLVNLFFGPAASCADALVRSLCSRFKRFTSSMVCTFNLRQFESILSV